ncbi:GntR family transcriptional regulator [Chromobacterium subtsugae]|uniref:GntR family transcriptional regulator n=1 Tax=Chromobacterium subtsugae TaxID=251747 RepID=A0ABS7FCA0_9NEIS|nr:MULTISPECIES: GntR family transcriptional regulator [Chromobacterium]KUM02127.1 GntR family transcriptional regulator [Chromobacterium subtsugae]KZE85793.1 GntR family transcriptional regulator [Chromobacterium sp. F49]MBW7566433.1 GntR family transcriptional regulator [Chromobacterium subtsugae]MBW8287708.1 GntR family transcriptional regulator [Chromobacterium subtsugae]OBU85375.1 GntR family transcriptional regulator [Chromobacterium subtsugae]
MTFKANDLLTEQIAQYLGKQIIQGDMQPGERIQELRIAAELEVSRGSVREALLILQRRHLVDIFPRRGAVVASIGARDVRDFFDLWFLLLDRVAQNLAAGWQNDDLARFIELMAQLEEDNRRDDLQAFYEHGIEFLSALYNHADNRYLTDTLNDMLPLTQRCLYAILRAGKSQMDNTYRFLESLLKTLIARDTSRLKQMVATFGQEYSQLAQTAAEALEGRR